MEKSADQAETLYRAGRESAHLTIQCITDFELFREEGDSLRGSGVRKLIQAAEEEQVLTSGEARVKTVVRAGVEAQAAADVTRMVNGVVSCDTGTACCGHEERGKNTQERGLASPVGPEKRERFAHADIEGQTGQRDNCRFFEWLEKSAPTTAGRGKRLFKRFNRDRRFSHWQPYSVSSVRRQSAGGHRDETGVRRAAVPGCMAKSGNPR